MNWARRLIAYFRPTPVAKTPDQALPPHSVALQREAKALLADLRELKRFEIVVRKR